ncbi:hypothetical protein FNB79_04325 [Formosa sediminum]|uniref:Uncharacterized protein n=1 Tax=Formosa sediminum TaxID=2594004 RepID=A0A516GNX5_9FLAO|nr:hypothetical protein [Formosa sediminum]QDO93232.1 hypothetical protein FNB79_04325 [Formosa sediminum]
MRTATLKSNQFNISEAIFSDFESLNQSVFNNEKLVPKCMNTSSKLVLVVAFILLVSTVIGLFAFQQLLKDIYLNPIYYPLNYGLYIIASGWFVFNGGISLYKLHLYLKFKPLNSLKDICTPIGNVSIIKKINTTNTFIFNSIKEYLKPVFVINKTQQNSIALLADKYSIGVLENHYNLSFKHIKNNIHTINTTTHHIFEKAWKRLDEVTNSLLKNQNLDYST